MTPPTEPQPTVLVAEAKNWASVRTILEGAILAALLWTGNGLMDMKLQMATLQTQLAIVNANLGDMKELRASVSALTIEVASTKQQVSLIERDRSDDRSDARSDARYNPRLQQ